MGALQPFTGNLQGNRWTQWKTVSPTGNTCAVNRVVTVFYFMVQGMTVGITGNDCWWNRGPTGKQVNTGKNCFTYREYVCSATSNRTGFRDLDSFLMWFLLFHWLKVKITDNFIQFNPFQLDFWTYEEYFLCIRCQKEKKAIFSIKHYPPLPQLQSILIFQTEISKKINVILVSPPREAFLDRLSINEVIKTSE